MPKLSEQNIFTMLRNGYILSVLTIYVTCIKRVQNDMSLYFKQKLEDSFIEWNLNSLPIFCILMSKNYHMLAFYLKSVVICCLPWHLLIDLVPNVHIFIIIQGLSRIFSFLLSISIYQINWHPFSFSFLYLFLIFPHLCCKDTCSQQSESICSSLTYFSKPCFRAAVHANACGSAALLSLGGRVTVLIHCELMGWQKKQVWSKNKLQVSLFGFYDDFIMQEIGAETKRKLLRNWLAKNNCAKKSHTSASLS